MRRNCSAGSPFFSEDSRSPAWGPCVRMPKLTPRVHRFLIVLAVSSTSRWCCGKRGQIRLRGPHLYRFHALTGSPHSGQSFPDTPLVRCACGRASDRPGAAVSTIIRLAGGDRVAEAVNINDVLDGHIVLDVECLDRIYLNGYVPNLQVPGQVVTFLTEHLGNPIPSPALFKRIGDRFREAVRSFAETNGIPVLHLNTPDRSRWDDRKVDHVREYIDQASEPGVVAIVVAQEVQKVFMGYTRRCTTGSPQFGFDKADRRVTVYYFYLLDPAFGVGFIKICSYFPYPLKMWVNGHEWAKRQATAAGLAFTELANGFATCADAARLQAICDRLSPAKLQAFFNYWITRIPCPFTRADRQAGYWWQLSMRQVEVSRTLVLDAPRRARAFFEALVADNIGIGRPAVVSMLFARRVQRNTQSLFRTRIFTEGTQVRLDFAYKHCRVKLYLKEGRALRIETVVNDPDDLDILKGLAYLPQVQRTARQINARVLTMPCVGQSCAIETALF